MSLLASRIVTSAHDKRHLWSSRRRTRPLFSGSRADPEAHPQKPHSPVSLTLRDCVLSHHSLHPIRIIPFIIPDHYTASFKPPSPTVHPYPSPRLRGRGVGWQSHPGVRGLTPRPRPWYTDSRQLKCSDSDGDSGPHPALERDAGWCEALSGADHPLRSTSPRGNAGPGSPVTAQPRSAQPRGVDESRWHHGQALVLISGEGLFCCGYSLHIRSIVD